MQKRILFTIAFILQLGYMQAGLVILNGLSHTYKVENGQIYKGKIAIENTGNTTQNVKIFPQDFSYKSDGTITYSTVHTNSKTNADWIKLNTNTVALKAKEKTDIYYEILIPNNIERPGSYWSVLIVEPIDDIKPSDAKVGVNITSVVRYAIQIITDYKTENIKPELKFEGVKVDKKADKRFLNIAIANNGALYCKLATSVDIYSKKSGQKTGNFSSLPMGLLPDTSKTFYIDISKLPPDKYNAAIIATDEDENAFALNVELEIKND